MPSTTIQNTDRDEPPTTETDADASGGTDRRPSSEAKPNAASGAEDSAERRDGLRKDAVFGLLSAKRRRKVLEYLEENGGQTTLSDVAEHIAAAEHDTDVPQLTSEQRKRVYVALYQCHLPKLDDAGVIEYDRDRGTIELRERAEQLFPHLSLDPDRNVVVRSPGDLVRSTRLYDLSRTLVDGLGR